jgi:formamidopyrimidine-DNA glycosylase
MPELPEVEIIRRGLERLTVGRRIAAVECRETRSWPGFSAEVASQLQGAAVVAVGRRGKLLIIDLDNSSSLLIHLRMTGQLVFRPAEKVAAVGTLSSPASDSPAIEVPATGALSLDESFGGGHPNASLIQELPDKTTRVIVSFTDDSHLYFNDQRKFGYFKLVPTPEVDDDPFLQQLGPEPLTDDFSWQEFKSRLPLNSKRAIKAVLLDQSIVAGVGNIYADESLFGAGIHPERPVFSLSDREIKKLHGAVRSCMQQSIDDGGSTARNYVDSEGMRGEYLDLHAQVFNRRGQPCPRCGHPVEKTRVAGRGTHICSRCQR